MKISKINHLTPPCLDCMQLTTEVVEGLFDTRFGISQSYSILQCNSCRLEQTYPLPSEQELKSLYEDNYNYVGGPANKSGLYSKIRSLFQSSWLWSMWLNIDGDISFHSLTGKGRLLDLGCNEGASLNFYKLNGYEVEGLELNTIAADVARSKGFCIHLDSIENFSPVNKYDVVVLSNVLEHSLAPHEMLVHAHRILKPSGQLWISCPNSKSFFRKIFGKYWINWHVPFHISHFSNDTLTGILKKAGFTIKHTNQASPALWITHSIITTIFSRRGAPSNKLRSVAWVIPIMIMVRVFGFPFLWVINRAGNGDCLLCIAYKQ